MTLKKGATVKLKSGGPIMTVQYETAGSQIFCQWFVESELHKGSFAEDSLEPANPMMQPEH